MSYKFKKVSLFGRDKNGELKDFSVLSQSEEFEALENKVEDIEDVLPYRRLDEPEEFVLFSEPTNIGPYSVYMEYEITDKFTQEEFFGLFEVGAVLCITINGEYFELPHNGWDMFGDWNYEEYPGYVEIFESSYNVDGDKYWFCLDFDDKYTNGEDIIIDYAVIKYTNLYKDNEHLIDGIGLGKNKTRGVSARGCEAYEYGFSVGFNTKALNVSAHAEGSDTIASGGGAHAEGNDTIASFASTHAEGSRTSATAQAAHAEGMKTEANGQYAHSEGLGTKANGKGSHAEGYYTEASLESQHVEGISNIPDTTSLHIVGNGTWNYKGALKKSNAHTLDKKGNAWFAGDVYVGSTSGTNKDVGSKKLAREDYILPLLHYVTGDYPELPTYPKENVMESLMETVMQLIGAPPEENTQLPPSATMEGKKITYGVIAPINRACCLVRLCAYIPQLNKYAAIEPTPHLIDYFFAYSFDCEVADQVMPMIVDTDGTIRLRIQYLDIISGLYTEGQEFTVNVNG